MEPSRNPRENDVPARRKAARRTALWLALVAGAIYVAFILSGVLGRGCRGAPAGATGRGRAAAAAPHRGTGQDAGGRGPGLRLHLLAGAAVPDRLREGARHPR